MEADKTPLATGSMIVALGPTFRRLLETRGCAAATRWELCPEVASVSRARGALFRDEYHICSSSGSRDRRHRGVVAGPP